MFVERDDVQTEDGDTEAQMVILVCPCSLLTTIFTLQAHQIRCLPISLGV
jgi:hypothetical protein